MFSALNKFRPLFLLADLVLVLLALFGGEYLRAHVHLPGMMMVPAAESTWLTTEITISGLIAWFLSFQITGIHEPKVLPARGTWRAIIVADLLGTGIFLSLLFFLKVTDFSRGLMLYTICLMVGFHILRHSLTRLCLGTLLRPFAQRVLLIGEGEIGAQLTDRVLENQWGIELVGGIAPHGTLEGLPKPGKLIDLPSIVERERIDTILIALPSDRHELVCELVLRLQSLPVRIHVMPDLLNLTLSRASVEDFYGVPIVGLREPPIGFWGRIFKRLLDIVGSLIGIVLAAPFMLAVTAAIRIYDGGPAFFLQKRIGENGRPFDMYKFRSMVVDAESRLKSLGIDMSKLKEEDMVFKMKKDPRVTPVGRFIRRWSLDELPQLFNVLKGDMSLVGPRPEDAKVAARYSFFHRKRLAVKPGLTGPMQVSGRGDLSMKKRMSLDLSYIDNWSFWLDIKIILLTIPSVLSGKGAY